MVHAKTAVADWQWARVGSTNLNIASWLGNLELDAVVDNEDFAHQMEEQYLRDLTHATEAILDTRCKVRAPGEPRHHVPATTSGGGKAGRAAAGAIRIGNAVGAAVGNRRVLQPFEARFIFIGGLLVLGLEILFAEYPKVAAYPLAVVLGWISIGLVYRAYKLFREGRARRQLARR